MKEEEILNTVNHLVYDIETRKAKNKIKFQETIEVSISTKKLKNLPEKKKKYLGFIQYKHKFSDPRVLVIATEFSEIPDYKNLKKIPSTLLHKKIDLHKIDHVIVEKTEDILNNISGNKKNIRSFKARGIEINEKTTINIKKIPERLKEIHENHIYNVYITQNGIINLTCGNTSFQKEQIIQNTHCIFEFLKNNNIMDKI